MTLDEAIEHARWCANNSIGECSDEHWRLVEWLTELQKLRATRTSLLAEIHGLRSQDDKLREFAKYAIYCAEGDLRCEGCPLRDKSNTAHIICHMHRIARELGIEVEA